MIITIILIPTYKIAEMLLMIFIGYCNFDASSETARSEGHQLRFYKHDYG